jgi:hypothetical protein
LRQIGEREAIRNAKQVSNVAGSRRGRAEHHRGVAEAGSSAIAAFDRIVSRAFSAAGWSA